VQLLAGSSDPSMFTRASGATSTVIRGGVPATWTFSCH